MLQWSIYCVKDTKVMLHWSICCVKDTRLMLCRSIYCVKDTRLTLHRSICCVKDTKVMLRCGVYCVKDTKVMLRLCIGCVKDTRLILCWRKCSLRDGLKWSMCYEEITMLVLLLTHSCERLLCWYLCVPITGACAVKVLSVLVSLLALSWS
jgi:hypothetical protein